jgi:hypothetical protein
MATRLEASAIPAQVSVTFGQVEAALKAVPVNLLPEVYQYLLELAEEAEDLAMIEARRNEPTRPVEGFFAELDAEEAARN